MRRGVHNHLATSSRSFSSIEIPEPTWSVASLQLDRDHEPIPRDELDKLARRALIRVDDSNATQLQQDVGNMMYLLSQVVSHAKEEDDDEHSTTDTDDGGIYDVARPGTPCTPLCRETQTEEDEAMKIVWKSQLEHKTVSVGAHRYFAIQTQPSGK